MSMYSRLHETAIRYPDHDAVVMNDIHVSRSQLLIEIQKTENMLLRFGIKCGDTVTVSLPNCPEIVYIIYACNKLGAAVNLIHAGHDASGIISKAAYTDSRLIIASLKELTSEDVINFASAVVPVVVLPWTWGKKPDKQKKEIFSCKKASFKRNIYFWNRCIRISNRFFKYDMLRAEKYEPADIAALISTSGTSGGGTKIVALPDSAVVADADRTGDTMFDYDKHCQMLVAIPVSHVFGFVIGIQCAIVNREGACVFMDNAANLLSYPKIIQENRIEVISAVPSTLRYLLSLESFKGDYSFLKLIFSGGESADEKLIESFNDKLKLLNSDAVVRLGYGMTETASVITVNKPEEYNTASVGKPLDGVGVMIINPNEKNGSGEIAVSGDTLMCRYYKDDMATDSVFFTDSNGVRWFKTGDLGHFDKDGFLIFDGRCKDIAIINGNNVSPAEIERVLLKYEPIGDCCVLGIDTGKGTELYAAVVTDDGFTHSDYIKYCSSRLLPHEIPYNIVNYESLPRNINGKKDVKKISEDIIKKQAECV